MEHKPLPRPQHFRQSINPNFYSFHICDYTFDNYGLVRCGKAGTAIMIRKSLQTVISQVYNIQNNLIIGIEVRIGCYNYFIYLLCIHAI